jgi:phosphatidylglycerophosphatase A
LTEAATPTPPASGADRAALWVLSCGGLGFLPLVPGTFGSLAGVVVVLVTFGQGPLHGLLGACVLTVLLGPAACRAAGRKDPSAVVMDEVAGMILALQFTPDPTPMQVAWGFLFFRAFDILKPPPARLLEKLPGGWGILLDDLAAGLYAAAALWGLGRIVPLA